MYKKVAKIALDVNIRERSVNVYKNMGWLPLHLRRQVHLSSYMYRIINETCPKHKLSGNSHISLVGHVRQKTAICILLNQDLTRSLTI